MSGQPDRPEPETPAEASEEAAGKAAEEAEEGTGAAAESSAEGQETPDVAALEARASENWDKYLRAMAELENVRKRAARDVEHARRYSLESFARELLAVRDSLELGLDAEADAESLREGSRATLKLLASSMEQFGITEVDPLGEPFDPQLHEAMMMQPSTEAEPGTVLTVYQKGYSLNGRLLRPARVVVADEAPSDTSGGQSGA